MDRLHEVAAETIVFVDRGGAIREIDLNELVLRVIGVRRHLSGVKSILMPDPIFINFTIPHILRVIVSFNQENSHNEIIDSCSHHTFISSFYYVVPFANFSRAS